MFITKCLPSQRQRETETDRERGRETGWAGCGKQPFWVPALSTNFWHFISKFIFCTANMATLGLGNPTSPTSPLLYPHPLPFSHCLEKLFPALNCLPLCTTSPCNHPPALLPSTPFPSVSALWFAVTDFNSKSNSKFVYEIEIGNWKSFSFRFR